MVMMVFLGAKVPPYEVIAELCKDKLHFNEGGDVGDSL